MSNSKQAGKSILHHSKMKLFGAFLAAAQAGTWEIPETWRYCEAREQVDPRSRYDIHERVQITIKDG